jgi:hypothetical protein
MEKVKPLWDEIWCRRPLEGVEIEDNKEEMERLQKEVTKIETKQMIQNCINQAFFAKMNPGGGQQPSLSINM